MAATDEGELCCGVGGIILLLDVGVLLLASLRNSYLLDSPPKQPNALWRKKGLRCQSHMVTVRQATRSSHRSPLRITTKSSVETRLTHLLLTITISFSSFSSSLALFVAHFFSSFPAGLHLSFFLVFPNFPQPTAQDTFSSCMAFHYLTVSPSTVGNAPLSCNMFSLERFHRPFCVMNPPISKSFHNLLYSSLKIFLFCPSILQFLASLAGILLNDLIRFHILPYSFLPHLLRLAAVHQCWSHCTKSELHLACPFFLPYRVLQMSLSSFSQVFDKYFGPMHVPCIFMYLLPHPHLMHRYLLASAHHSVRCFVFFSFSSTKIHFSFCFGLSSSQSFHSPTKQ